MASEAFVDPRLSIGGREADVGEADGVAAESDDRVICAEIGGQLLSAVDAVNQEFEVDGLRRSPDLSALRHIALNRVVAELAILNVVHAILAVKRQPVVSGQGALG